MDPAAQRLLENPFYKRVNQSDAQGRNKGGEKIFDLEIRDQLVRSPQEKRIDHQFEQTEGDNDKGQGKQDQKPSEKIIDDTVHNGDNDSGQVIFYPDTRDNMCNEKNSSTQNQNIGQGGHVTSPVSWGIYPVKRCTGNSKLCQYTPIPDKC